MIAMQYSFDLPAIYDMALIEQRVRDKGRAFDDTSGLAIKAFLSARRGDPQTGTIQSWSVLNVSADAALAEACFATRTVDPIQPFESLSLLREREQSDLESAFHRGAIFSLSGFDAKTWQRIRFCLWRNEIPALDRGATAFNVLHTSMPQGMKPF